jgi:hypothetical protein
MLVTALFFVLANHALARGAEPQPAFVAVLPVQSASGLSADRARLVLETARAGLAAEELIVVPQEHVASSLAAISSSCGAPAECRRALATRLEVRFLFQVQVEEPSAQDFDVTVRVLDPETDTELASFTESCTICSEADLQRVVRERTLDARSALQRHLHPEDEDAGRVEPQVVEAPPPAVEVRLAERSALVPAGWGLVGGGAVATVGGAVLLALTGSSAGCPDDPRGGACLPLVYQTIVPGAIATSVGVALVATGAALIVVGKKRDARANKNARVAVGPGSLRLDVAF